MEKAKIEKTQVFGFESALRGLRNPMNSWDKSDSFNTFSAYKLASMDGYIGHFTNGLGVVMEHDEVEKLYSANVENFVLGEADKILAQKLTKAGSEHCKFLRQIHVWVDFTLPRYVWSELDTYHYNTKNSTSTMHKLMSRELTLNDFIFNSEDTPLMHSILSAFGRIRFDYLQTDDVKTRHYLLRRAKQLLPEGYLQMRTMDTNYAELLNIYKQRWNHKLPEWHEICKWIEGLPYFVELTGIERKFS